MSRHEGVSCDACMASNFGGRRFKCLVCFDFDLCGSCHDAGHTGSSHSAAHPVQCILTREDYDLYYGGEGLNPEVPQSLTCPLCGELGFSAASLPGHVAEAHAEDSGTNVICPICAAVPNGDPNRMTPELASHLATWHLSDPDRPDPVSRSSARRAAAARGPQRQTAVRGRGASRATTYAIHSNSGYSIPGGGSDSSDPITELLSQLGGLRRPNANYTSTLAQIHQLQQGRAMSLLLDEGEDEEGDASFFRRRIIRQLGRGSSSAAPRRALIATVPREEGAGSRATLSRTYNQALWEEELLPPSVSSHALLPPPRKSVGREGELLLPRLSAESWRAAEAGTGGEERWARRETLAALLADSLHQPLHSLLHALPSHLPTHLNDDHPPTDHPTKPNPSKPSAVKKKSKSGSEKQRAVVQPVVVNQSRPTAMVAPTGPVLDAPTHPTHGGGGGRWNRVASVPPVNVVANPVQGGAAAEQRAPAQGVVIGIPGHLPSNYAVISTASGTRMSRAGSAGSERSAGSGGGNGNADLRATTATQPQPRTSARLDTGPTPV